MKFIVGSTNKRKIEVARKTIGQFFKIEEIEISGCQVDSKVPETPYDKETFDGARNRASGAQNQVPDCDFFIGLESGLIERYGHIFEEVWAVVLTKDSKEFLGYSSGLKVPDYILKKMDDMKMNHCDVMEILEKELKKSESDTWGLYSGDSITRDVSLEEALRNAFIQIKSKANNFYQR